MSDIPNALCGEYAEMSKEICRELVRRPSEDPPGDTRAAASYISSLLSRNGIRCETVSPHAEKPSVIAAITGGRLGKHVVFNGHIDTFPAGDLSKWTVDPFGGEMRDGRLYGRGAADMKGGVAASLAAFLMLNRLKDSLPGKVSITCVSDEEVGGPWGTRYLLKNRPELYGDVLINGEPSSTGHVRIGEKGAFRARIIVDTSGGHGAYADFSANAIAEMTTVLNLLSGFGKDVTAVDPRIRRLMENARESYEALLGPGSVEKALSYSINFGTIRGGIMVNMIAENCEAEIDCRFPPGTKCAVIEDWLKGIVGKVPHARYEIIKRTEPVITPPDHPYVQMAKDVVEKITGKPASVNFSLGGTEAVLWRSNGIPAVTYGPAHHHMGAADEYVVADELPVVAEAHARIAWRYLHGDY